MDAAGRAQLDRLAGPEFARLWRRARAVVEQRGSAWSDVAITLRDPAPEERRAIRGLVGRHLRGADIRVELHHIDVQLRQGPTGFGLLEVLAALGGELRDRPSEAVALELAVERAVAAAAASPLTGERWYGDWLSSLRSDGALTRLAGRGQLDQVPVATAVLERLPADGVPLAVLSSSVTGDPKALGPGTLATLVLRALAHRSGVPRPARAGERRELWERSGVVADDLASQVLVLNLPVEGTTRGLGAWLAEAAADGVPMRITLHQLARYPLALAAAGPRTVSVCENPAVLRAAAGRFGAAAAPLVCTEGQPSVAFSRLAGALVDAGCNLRYHGDFDWAGVRMAAALFERHDARPWRFGAQDYLEGLAGVDSGDLASLDGAGVTTPWDPALADALRERGVVLFEEQVLERLLPDLDLRRADRSQLNAGRWERC